MSADNTTGDEVDTNNPDDLRQLGNHQFAQNNFDVAATFYTQALELVGQDYLEASESESGSGEKPKDDNKKDMPPPPTSLLLNLCNRSACYFQMEMYEEAKKDAEMAWNFLPQLSNIKAAYRLVKCLIALEKYDEGKEMILRVFQVLEEVEVEAKKKAEREAMEKRQNDATADPMEKDVPPRVDETVKTQYRAFEELFKTLEKKRKNQGKEAPKVSIRDFTLDDELGFGNFSEIYKVTHKKTGKEFALKRIKKKKIADLG